MTNLISGMFIELYIASCPVILLLVYCVEWLYHRMQRDIEAAEKEQP